MARTVITFGSFDLLHYGHVSLLQRARALGDRLVVGVSTEAMECEKGKCSQTSYAQRAGLVGALDCVDAVFPEESFARKATYVLEHDAAVFVMGDDWRRVFDDLGDICDVVYLPRTPGISSTAIRAILGDADPETGNWKPN